MAVKYLDQVGESWMAAFQLIGPGWDPSCTVWSAKGMMHEVLYGDWPVDEVGEDED